MSSTLAIRGLGAVSLCLSLAAAACTPSSSPTPAADVEAPEAAPLQTPPAPAGEPVVYPASRQEDVTDDYFGTTVPDPYRWLENSDAEEVAAWVAAQNTVTRGHLDALPHRDTVHGTVQKLWTYDRTGLPKKAGDRRFFTTHDGQANQPVLNVRDTADAEPRVLLDANTLSEDGTVALADWVPSDDGSLLAWGVADGGSDWRIWRVRDVATGKDLPDELRWLKFTSVSWTPDGKGFFYARFPEPGEAFEETLAFQSVYYHRLGTPQTDDILVHDAPDHPNRGFWAEVSEDGTRLFVHVSEGTEEKARLHWYALSDLDLDRKGGRAGGTLHKPLDAFDANYTRLGEVGDTVYVLTDHDAPRSRVIAFDLTDTEPVTADRWREVVPQNEHTLTSGSLVGGKLITRYLADAASKVTVHSLDGSASYEVALPGLGSAWGFDGKMEDKEVFFGFHSFTTPPSTYRLSIEDGAVTHVQTPDVPVDLDRYVVEQVRYASKDGTEIPMFLVHRKDVTPTGDVPTLLYGYGGFNISITPSYSAAALAWADMGGLYAVANLRGGGEYGRAWHEAGTKQNKQNVFDDFIAGAEHLIAQNWTTPDHLAIHGRSNGGLLVGATMTQRPDLFAAAVPGVGVLDMLRYHTFTIGWAWASDYGTSADSAEMFQYLRGYSPVHNTVKGTDYPATLVLTGDHDDRVVPGHSFKFTAALQRDHAGSDPVLARIETRGGHGAGTPTSMKVDEWTDVYSFLLFHLGAAPKQ